MNVMRELLRPREVAEELGVSVLTVYRRIQTGELQAVRVGENGPLRVSAAAVGHLLRPAREHPDGEAA